MEKRFVYADNAATTRVSDEVVAAMLPYFTEYYGNPSAVYGFAGKAKTAIENARAQVAAALGATPGEIYFVSCGTEADNWALKGTARMLAEKGRHIISTPFEHHAILHSLNTLEKEGFEVTYLPVYDNGRVKVEDLKAAIRPDTILVSVMFANNEIGTIQPIAEIGAVCRERGILFHTDAVQAIGHVPVDVQAMNIDMLSLSGHKFHAPKGIGAMYLRKGVGIPNFMDGGGQEKNVRPGTAPIANLCAMGLSSSLLMAGREENHKRVTEIRGALLEGLTKLPDICINSPADSTPYILNFSALGVRSEIMLHFLEEKGIYVSSGSACAKGEPSHVLLAMDLARERADSAIRLSFGRYNTLDEVPVFLEAVSEALKRFRR